MFKFARLQFASSLFLSSFLIQFTASAQPANSGDTFVRPPSIFSYKKMQKWVESAQQRIAPQLSVRLVDTPEWSEYVNHHHFVPLTCEGVPSDFVFDYNWDGHKASWKDHRKLPTAEVTETGEFVIWWDFCNFREFSQQQCTDFINTAISHENRHHIQWMALAAEAVEKATKGSKVGTAFPQKIGDLRKIPGAAETFMQKWGNCGHYQCREVDVYTTQIITGEMPFEMAQQRLNNLNEYYNGCKESEFEPDFKSALDRADVVFGWFGYERKDEVNPFK